MIGIFDSGSGGLTVLRAIREEMPDADVVYFGDIKSAPYGEKSQEELFRLTGEALRLLTSRGATSLVSACNSVSTSLAVSLFDTLSVAPDRLIEMVGPTVGYFRNSDMRIGLVATVATIDSGIYQNAFRMLGKDISAIAIPELAGAIERGARSEEVERIIAEALPSEARSFDVLILGCTHYPLVIDAFRRVLGDIEIFDPAFAVAERVKEAWWPREVGEGKTTFLISKESPVFREFVATMVPQGGTTIEVIE